MQCQWLVPDISKDRGIFTLKKLVLCRWRHHSPSNCQAPVTSYGLIYQRILIPSNTTVKTSDLTQDRTYCVGSQSWSVQTSISSYKIWQIILIFVVCLSVCLSVCGAASVSKPPDRFFSKCYNWDFQYQLLESNNFQLHWSKIKQYLAKNIITVHTIHQIFAKFDMRNLLTFAQCSNLNSIYYFGQTSLTFQVP